MDQVQGVADAGQFARICVFCGSSSGKKAIYTQVAEELGTELVKRGINLVYGGGSIGLMGTVAQAAHTAGGHVVGVIPKALMPKEICGSTVGELVAVDDMHQRKAEMARRADAFIALPGGYGTFEELLEIITWAQLGIHKKPVGLLNVDGYYDAILALFNKALEEGFLNLASHNIVVTAPTAAELLDKLKNYKPTEDKSVPQLTWDSVMQEPASTFPAVMVATGTNSAVHDPALHLAGSASTTMRAFNTGVPHTGIRKTDGRAQTSLLLSRGTGRVSTFQASAFARSGHFSVHPSHKFGRKTGTPIDAHGDHAAALGARVITPLIV